MFPNMQFSSGSLYIKDELIGPTIPEIPPIDINEPPNYVRSINFPLSTEAEFTVEAEIDAPVFYELCDIPPTTDAQTFTIQYQGTVTEQVRKHKKKRINKKWAKRYGYRTVLKTYQMNEVRFEKGATDEFELLLSGPPRVVKGV